MSDEDFLPGTKRLYDAEGRAVAHHSELKKQGEIVLATQPTDHPDDPLQWSPPRKYWHAILLLLITALTGATTNESGSAQFTENAELGIRYKSFNIGAGVLFLGIGYWTLFISPFVWLYGRRISYLVCLMLGVIGGIWFARGEKTSDAIWNQLFVSASESCSEAHNGGIQEAEFRLWLLLPASILFPVGMRQKKNFQKMAKVLTFHFLLPAELIPLVLPNKKDRRYCA